MTSDSGRLIITQSDAEVVRLNNNMLSSWDGFSDTFHTLLLSPQQLSWIDLSFNDLRSIHSVREHSLLVICQILKPYVISTHNILNLETDKYASLLFM